MSHIARGGEAITAYISEVIEAFLASKPDELGMRDDFIEASKTVLATKSPKFALKLLSTIKLFAIGYDFDHGEFVAQLARDFPAGSKKKDGVATYIHVSIRAIITENTIRDTALEHKFEDFPC